MKQRNPIYIAFLFMMFLMIFAACNSRRETTGPLSLLPNDARNALNQRVKSEFGTDEYTVINAQKSASGTSWCIVFDPPLKGQLLGRTLLYDYAVIQPDGDSWQAMMIEDHQDGVVLKFFGCDAVYKRSSQ